MKRSNVPVAPRAVSGGSGLDFFRGKKADKPSVYSDDEGSSVGDDDNVSLASLVAYGVILRAPADLDGRRREMLNDPALFQKRIEAAIHLKFDDVQIGFEEITSGVIDERGKRVDGKMNFGLFVYVENKASWIEETRDPSACGLYERLSLDRLTLTSREKECLGKAARDIFEALFGRKGPSSFPGSRDPNGIDLCHVLCM
jgi:hypothetical protein